MKNAFLILISLIVVRPSHASTVVYDVDREELVALKSSVESVFKKQCPEIENVKYYFGLNLESCLPKAISKSLQVKTPLFEGPNCFSQTFYALGIMDSLRNVSTKEANEIYFSKDSAFCTPIAGEESKPGDVVTFGDQYSQYHAFIYLTKKYGLNKTGPSQKFPWEIALTKDISAWWEGLKYKASRFSCKPAQLQNLENLTPQMKAISKFSNEFTEFLVTREHSRGALSQLNFAITELRNELSLESLKALSANSKNPFVKSKIYDIVNSGYTLTPLLKYYKNSVNDFGFYTGFKSTLFTYLSIVDDLLSVSSETYGIESYLTPEMNEYCYNKQSRICEIFKSKQ